MRIATRVRWRQANPRNCRNAGSRILRSKWPSRRKVLGSKPRRVPLELLLLKSRPHRRLPRHFPHRSSLRLRLFLSPPNRHAGHRRRPRRRSLPFPTGRNRNPLRHPPRRFPKFSSKSLLLPSLRSRKSLPLSVPHRNKLLRHPRRTRHSTVRSRTRLRSASSNSARSSAWTVK